MCPGRSVLTKRERELGRSCCVVAVILLARVLVWMHDGSLQYRAGQRPGQAGQGAWTRMSLSASWAEDRECSTWNIRECVATSARLRRRLGWCASGRSVTIGTGWRVHGGRRFGGASCVEEVQKQMPIWRNAPAEGRAGRGQNENMVNIAFWAKTGQYIAKSAQMKTKQGHKRGKWETGACP